MQSISNQRNSTIKFQGLYIQKNGNELKKLAQTQIKDFLANGKNLDLVGILEKRYKTDCLIVAREDGICLVQLGKQINNQFKLSYVTSTIIDFVKDKRKILAQISNPKHLAKEQSMTELRLYAKDSCNGKLTDCRVQFIAPENTDKL